MSPPSRGGPKGGSPRSNWRRSLCGAEATSPLEGGVLFDVARDVDVGFSLRFHRLIGPDADGHQRGIYFLGRFRF